MDSSGFLFDGSCHGNMLFVGNGDRVFRGPRTVLLSMEEALKKRPFFTSREEIEEEYYEDDHHLPEKKRRLTPEQVHLLERSFEAENKLEPERKTQLAKKLGLQPRQVAVWFQNRRARWKNKQLERDYDVLRSSYEALIADYDNVKKENERLRSEVVSLTEKLQANEALSVGPKADPPSENVVASDAHVSVKVEDRLSSGSVGSAVVDEDGPQLLVESVDSYFPEDYGVGTAINGVQSEEEEDGSDDNRMYFPDVFAAADQQNQAAVASESLGWWVWS
ncbi:homeobox-leucine zipper protein HAT5 [Magnolia sinica]|uniref:homeobox-leucine zipper protein HAT5 n=1 Tax=Magnolia sinica TaxID=86752 RepID=UPI0026586E47|nr:homeobox-leucine zipper protein HAT5 [Magnolia sinica]